MRPSATASILALLLGCSSLCALTMYRSPTEDPGRIVRRSTTILLARAIGQQDRADAASEELVDFEVVEVLKGDYTAATYTTTGNVDSYRGPNTGTVPYKWVRPGGLTGTGYATDYRIGGLFLLLLKNGSPYWAHSYPTNEEVQGKDDPWVTWVRGRIVEAAQRLRRWRSVRETPLNELVALRNDLPDGWALTDASEEPLPGIRTAGIRNASLVTDWDTIHSLCEGDFEWLVDPLDVRAVFLLGHSGHGASGLVLGWHLESLQSARTLHLVLVSEYCKKTQCARLWINGNCVVMLWYSGGINHTPATELAQRITSVLGVADTAREEPQHVGGADNSGSAGAPPE